jgi:uncharacterized protein YjbI with pentapeptide repeats
MTRTPSTPDLFSQPGPFDGEHDSNESGSDAAGTDGMRDDKRHNSADGEAGDTDQSGSEADSNSTATGQISARRLGRSEMESLLCAIDRQTAGALRFTDCDFDGADLSRLDLRGAEFHGCSLVEAADLVEAVFRQSDFNNARWRRAKLAAVLFAGCKLTGASFEEAACLGLVFEDSLLVGADLRKLSFRKQQLKQLDFSDADLSGCDFRDAVFLGGSLRHAGMKLTRFEGADLREADLGGLKLVDARLFKGATISHRQAAGILAELGLSVA